MNVLPLLLLVLPSLVHPAPAQAGSEPAPGSEDPIIAARIDEHFVERERNGFSGVLLLLVDGETVLEKAYGFRDPESRAPMRTTDVFDIGSIVKPITRAAIRKLEAQGKLSLEDPIAEFFPDVPEDKQQITIGHVLRHRAGFPDTFGGDYELIGREALRRALLAAPLVAPVGQEVHYSNSGYSLLAMIIEDVGGKPYEEWVHAEILRPAGVEAFGYRIPYWPRQTLAVGIRRNGERFGTPLEHAWYGDGPGWNLRGNGGMLANARGVHDLFLAMEQKDEVLGREARLAWRPPAQPGEPTAHVALGGNGVFNAAFYRSVTVPREGERREITFVGLSNIGGQEIEGSLEFLKEVLGLR